MDKLNSNVEIIDGLVQNTLEKFLLDKEKKDTFCPYGFRFLSFYIICFEKN